MSVLGEPDDPTSDAARPHPWVVRAGRRLRQSPWPSGKTCAVALSVDLDFETPWERERDVSPTVLSTVEFGTRRGIPNLVDLFERRGVRATFFVPGVAAVRYRDVVREIHDRGFEIGVHGWDHERPTALSPAVEREQLLRSLSAIEEVTGERPVGQRAPSFDTSASTLRLAEEAGLVYDSSLMGDTEPYGLVLDGAPAELVEIPVEWGRDDATFFINERWDHLRPVPDPFAVAAAWQAEFDAARAEGGLFQLTLHPDLIGHRARMAGLERLVDSMGEDVWFATHADVARHAKEEN